MKTRNLLYILPLAALTACEPDIDEMEVSRGSADFSKMVAVGNSLTAGFQSNALSAEGQENSLPNIIAKQLNQAGSGVFTQPIIPGDAGAKGVGLNAALPPGTVVPELVLRLAADCQGTVGPAPQLASNPYSGAEFFANVGANGPYNNVGVPGARLIHLNVAGYGSPQGNPYFARFASNPLETMLQAAMRNNPTFFQLWIGNNDVLGYSTSGGDDGGDAITAVPTFAALYAAALDTLTKNGAKGVVANIPNVTSIPYFTTVPIGTDAVDAASAALLNGTDTSGYGAYNAGLRQAFGAGFIDTVELVRRTINFRGGQINTFVVIDPTLTDLTGLNPRLVPMRHAVPGELMTLTLPGDSLRCAQWGTRTPIPGRFHLTTAEIQKINDATSSFNNIIKSEATSRGLAFVDANARLQELSTTGIVTDGISFSSALVTGGAFSLDGVHPSTRGYAIIANDFISAINATYGASIPKVSVGSYPTIELEQ